MFYSLIIFYINSFSLILFNIQNLDKLKKFRSYLGSYNLEHYKILMKVVKIEILIVKS